MADLNEVSILARRIMNDHGLGHVPFQFDNAKARFGVCKFRGRSGTWVPIQIALSQHLVRVNTLERCLETVLHEVAHALAGHEAGHGPAWRRQARALGIEPRRCGTHEDTVVPPAPHNGMCAQCSTTRPIGTRQRAPRANTTYRCPKHSVEVEWISARELARRQTIA